MKSEWVGIKRTTVNSLLAYMYGILFLFCFMQLTPVLSEHPHTVRKLEAEENYYGAYLSFLHLPPRSRTPASLISGGRSAWALSLPEDAERIFRKALTRSLIKEDEGEVLLSLAVIYFQERKFEKSLEYARMVVARFTQSHPYRGRAFYVMAQIAAEQVEYRKALKYIEEALPDASPDILPAVSFLQGEVLMGLSRLEEARQAYERVPVEHHLAGQTVRRLAHLATQLGDYDQAEFWLERGRSQHAALFLDSWVDYMFMKVALSRGDTSTIEALVASSTEKYPPSDPWLVLLHASAEEFLYRRASYSGSVVSKKEKGES